MRGTDPVNLTTAPASFDETYSPRIVARVNDYDVRIAHPRGEHVWHVHDHTDEFFLVLDGRFDVTTRAADGRETTTHLRAGDAFVVPKWVEHKPSSDVGAIGDVRADRHLTTGARHEGAVPGYVDSTAGHDLACGADAPPIGRAARPLLGCGVLWVVARGD